jgi:hydroxymethylglutaryl-CoA lyase
LGLPVGGYVSAAFWCAFEGKIAPDAVVDVVERLLDIGVDEVSVSYTVGKPRRRRSGRCLLPRS